MNRYDFLGLRCRCANRLEGMLWPHCCQQPCMLTECAARLLNAIVSCKSGRDYIGNHSIVHLLTWDEPSQAERPYASAGYGRIGDATAAHLMATIMKLTLNECQRLDMVHRGLFLWLVRHLNSIKCALMTISPAGDTNARPNGTDRKDAADKESRSRRISAYHIINATTVLMQLIAEWPDVRLVWDDLRQTLGLLGGFLHSDIAACRANVRATLMAMMHNARTAAMARALGFDKLLSRHLSECVGDRAERQECDMIVRAILRMQTVYQTRSSPVCKSDVSDFKHEMYI